MLRSPIENLASILFPACCCLCDTPLSRLTRAPVCDLCWNKLRAQTGTSCLRCSEDLGVATFISDIATNRPSDQLCQPCRLAPPPFERAVAYGGYDGTLRDLIHRLKYDGIFAIADRLGERLAEAIATLQPVASSHLMVIPVPLHAAKRRLRGFNHAELLARAAMRALRSRRADWELQLARGVLARKRATQSQAGLSPRQRRDNLRGAFFVPSPGWIEGRHVLLIDDIYTTGATARACSQTLKRAGAASVWVATVARPQRERTAVWQLDAEEVPMHEEAAFWAPKNVDPGKLSITPATF